MRILTSLGLLSVLALGSVLPAAADDVPHAPQEAVDAYAEAFATPGIAAAVLTDGELETVVRGHDGDGAEVTPRTPFRIASMSTSMTATAIMLLVQDDELTLDDKVAEVLPTFTMADPRHEEITVHQLLSHTSGLSLQTNDEYALPAPRSTTGVLAELDDRWLLAAPGTRFEYHNTNYSVAARIIEVISGTPLDVFLRERLFEPLGMHDSRSVDACDGVAQGLSQGYSVVLGIAYRMPEMPGRCGGNGGVVSTLADMVRWLRFNQGEIGTDLLERNLLAELHSVQPGTPASALGWERRAPGSDDAQGFASPGGTLATFTGSMAFVPTTGTAAVVLTNGVGSPGDLARNLIAGVDGTPTVPYENPLNVTNGILLGLTVLAAILLAATALRAPRWAARRRAARRPRTWLRLIPRSLVIVAGIFVPLAPSLMAGSIDWQYWVLDVWLFPLLVVLGAVLVLGGTSALVSRIVAVRVLPGASGRLSRPAPQPAAPVERTPVSPDATGPRART